MAEERYLELLNQLDDTLASLEKSIRMFDPDWRRKRQMEPKIAKSGPLLPKATYTSALARVLRSAAGKARS